MTTRVIFILDKSGSMRSILTDTIGGFNSYIEKLQQSDKADGITMSLVQFDSTAIEATYKDVPIKSVPGLDTDNFVPRDMTPLVEAMIKTIEAAAEKEASFGKTIVVTMTDGQENASKPEFTNKRLADLIAEKRGQGYEFIFLGAGIDAYAQAGKIGIGIGQTMSYDSADRMSTMDSYGAVAAQTLNVARGGSATFSASDKAAAGDKFVPPQGIVGGPSPRAKTDRLNVKL